MFWDYDKLFTPDHHNGKPNPIPPKKPASSGELLNLTMAYGFSSEITALFGRTAVTDIWADWARRKATHANRESGLRI